MNYMFGQSGTKVLDTAPKIKPFFHSCLHFIPHSPHPMLELPCGCAKLCFQHCLWGVGGSNLVIVFFFSAHKS